MKDSIVYIVLWKALNHTAVAGIFSTQQKAMDFIIKKTKLGCGDFEIQDVEVDKPEE